MIMKKQRIIGIVLLVAAGLLIAGTGVVYASGLVHGRSPIDSESGRSGLGDDDGPMGGFGMWMDEDSEFPPTMDAMIEAVSRETGLTVDEIQAKLLDGEHLFTIATDAGMSTEEYDTLMDETHDAYFEQYQEQFGSANHFNWMMDRMGGEWDENGFGSRTPNFDDHAPGFDGPGMPYGGCW
jgi:hypothetical protein